MRDINKMTYEEAIYMLDNQVTIREVAKKFKVSKSTVHNDLTTRLKEIDVTLFNTIKEILNYNISVRHIRGGEATRRKYLKEKK